MTIRDAFLFLFMNVCTCMYVKCQYRLQSSIDRAPKCGNSGKRGVYWFPRAAVTKYLKLGDLRQQKFILMVPEG